MMSCTSSIEGAQRSRSRSVAILQNWIAPLLGEDDATALVAAAAAAVAPPTGPALATIPTSNARAAGRYKPCFRPSMASAKMAAEKLWRSKEMGFCLIDASNCFWNIRT